MDEVARRRGVMTRSSLVLTVCATLLWTGTVLAAPTAQQNCDTARITAWRLYVSCVNGTIARDARGVHFDEFAAFARCRHSYFKKWAGFQTKGALNGTSCRPVGASRFQDNADGTVTDNLSGLVWEQKADLDGNADLSDPHDADNLYAWSTSAPGAPWPENGTAFTSFLMGPTGVNTTAFAGVSGWRLPTVAELQTVVLDFPCTGPGLGATCRCTSSPCVDPALGAGSTQGYAYWSATSYVPNANCAWYVTFVNGDVYVVSKTDTPAYVRAVHGGL
jgi:hypothetical protein